MHQHVQPSNKLFPLETMLQTRVRFVGRDIQNIKRIRNDKERFFWLKIYTFENNIRKDLNQKRFLEKINSFLRHQVNQQPTILRSYGTHLFLQKKERGKDSHNRLRRTQFKIKIPLQRNS